MTVTQLITIAFRLAASRYPDLHQTWVKASFQIGSLLPNSLLVSSVQRAGQLDMVLRCMEDDFSLPPEGAKEDAIFSGDCQIMLSELWIGVVYEIFRLLIERKLAFDNDEFMALAHDLRLLRIPLEKHEIAADRKLSGPLLMRKHPSNNDETDRYRYLNQDAQRAHIMPTGISGRGSVMWNVIDVEASKSYWLERRALSERIVVVGESGAAIQPISADWAN
jgi:hypothetical protein